MENNIVTLKILNPRGEIMPNIEVQSSPRLESLPGKSIAILNNTKAGGETLLPFFKNALQKRYRDLKLKEYTVHFAASLEEKEPKIKKIAEENDAVIAMMGD